MSTYLLNTICQPCHRTFQFAHPIQISTAYLHIMDSVLQLSKKLSKLFELDEQDVNLVQHNQILADYWCKNWLAEACSSEMEL